MWRSPNFRFCLFLKPVTTHLTNLVTTSVNKSKSINYKVNEILVTSIWVALLANKVSVAVVTSVITLFCDEDLGLMATAVFCVGVVVTTRVWWWGFRSD